MLDAFSIAVKLNLAGTLARGLSTLSADFIALNKHAGLTEQQLGNIEKRLNSIKKMTLIGGAMAGAGFAMLGALKGPAEEAMEWERTTAKLRQMGLGDQQLADAQKFARATQIIGTSMQDRYRLFQEAQGAFRESGMDGAHALDAAKVMMPVLAQYQAASNLLEGPHKMAAEQAMMNLNKTVEIMGGLNSPQRAAEIAEGVFKAAQSSGRLVDERQLKQFVAYGSSATNSMSMRAIFGGLEPIIGEMSGSTVATGLRTAFTRMSGAMSLPPKRMLSVLENLGLAEGSGKETRMRRDMLTMMQTDAPAFAAKMMEIYSQHGITSVLDRELNNALLFGTNGAKIYNKIMSQLPVIQRSEEAFDKAHGMGQVIADNKGGPLSAMQQFHKALDDLGLVVGQTVLPAITKMIHGLTDVLEVLNRHPKLLTALTWGFTGLATAMAIGGTLTLVAGGFSAIGLALGVAGGAGLAGGGTGLIGALTGVLGPLGLVIGLFTTLGLIAADDAKGHEWSKSLPSNIDHKGFNRRGSLAGFGGFAMPLPEGVSPSLAGAGRGSVVPPSGAQMVQVTTETKLDGKTIATTTSRHQAKSLGTGMTGGGIDPNVALPMPGVPQ